jgi:SAM-dependent methyltransferase
MDPNDLLAAGLADTRAYWEKKATAAGDDCARIEMSSRAQRMRFENFLVHHDFATASLLDVGCGAGGFFDHLGQRGFTGDYLGVDLTPEMVARCQARFPESHFECRNILEWPTERRWDFTLAFSIHNVRMTGGRELLESVTRRQFELCNRAAHVDLLTDRYEGFDAHIQPWRAEEILSLALSITPYVVLRHDYLPNAMSVTLYREPLIDTRLDLLLG